jgi:hypothetical protein
MMKGGHSKMTQPLYLSLAKSNVLKTKELPWKTNSRDSHDHGSPTTIFPGEASSICNINQVPWKICRVVKPFKTYVSVFEHQFLV